MRDAEAIADIVVQTMAAILAPLKASLAATEAKVADLTVQLDAVGTLRERVAVAEVKASREFPTVDLTSILVRLSELDLKLATLNVVETKSAPVATVDPVLVERLASVDSRVTGLDQLCERRLTELYTLGDRVMAMETKAALAVPFEPALNALSDRVRTLESAKIPDLEPVLQRVEVSVGDLSKDFGTIRERVAAVETRAPVPGPVGLKGADGKDGKDGKDGAAGVNLDDLSVEQQDERTWVIKGTVGARVKEIGSVTLSVPLYRDVWVDGRTYEQGDRVTWGGSEFHCNETTRTKPGESKAWTLAVKRGRDGKDGKDAPVMPVVSVGRGGGHA